MVSSSTESACIGEASYIAIFQVGLDSHTKDLGDDKVNLESVNHQL